MTTPAPGTARLDVLQRGAERRPAAHARAPGAGHRAGAVTRLLLAALTASLLAGCTGSSCDELGALQAEREQRRAEHQRLVEDRAPGDDDAVAAADDRLHAFERRVFALEQQCDR